MRVVFVGASTVAVRAAQLLLKQGHEVVIVEVDRERIDELSDELDCGFVHGDGSRPHILAEAAGERADVLFCLTGSDETNIIASLVGRSLGMERVVPAIDDPEFEKICQQLDLRDTIVPSRAIARYLADMASGVDIIEMSTMIKGPARFYCFEVGEDRAGPARNLGLPDGARAICFYRNGEFGLIDDGSRLKPGDEVVVLTHRRNLPELQEKWR